MSIAGEVGPDGRMTGVDHPGDRTGQDVLRGIQAWNRPL